MKITAFTLMRSHNSLKHPFTTALRSVDAINEIVLVVETDEKMVGLGSAPATLEVTGDDITRIEHELRHVIEPAFVDHELLDLGDSLKILDALEVCGSARAAFDIALHDLYAKISDQPLYRMLGGKAKILKTLYTISINTPQLMVRQAQEALDSGFDQLKIKLDSDVDSNLERIRALHENFPDAKLFLDLNQALSVNDTLKLIISLDGIKVELIEQPNDAQDIEGLAQITQMSDVPILADEAVFTLDQARKAIELKACDLINIKLMKCGGIHKASQIIELALDHGVNVLMGSMLESAISVTAALHLAFVYDNVIYADLDGPTLAKTSSYEGGIAYNKAFISLSEDAGLGIAL